MPKREKETVTQEQLRELLDYDPLTGIFTWKLNRRGGRGIVPGQRAGTVKTTGGQKQYRYIRINEVDYLAKRLAWFWVHNRWPSYLRCVDRDEGNCAIGNLLDQGMVTSEGGEDWKTPEGKASHRKRYARLNPERIRDQALRATFGVSLADYNRMLSEQNGVCAICGKFEKRKGRGGNIRQLAVDHCRDTSKVRGLLCADCNQGIGMMNHSVDILTRAIDYLKRTNGA